jgi:hypothetical protein
MASPKVTVPPPRDAVADSSEFGWGNTTISREQVMSRLHAQAHNAAGIAKRKADRAAFVAAHPETAPATTTAAPTTPTTRRHKGPGHVGPGHVRNPRHSHHGKPA